MLEPKHIIQLKIDRNRLEAHQNMPTPGYVTKELTGQFTTLSDAILTSILNVDTDVFRRQLELARQHGAEYISEDKNHTPIGVSAVTSLIKRGNIMHKNLIVPNDFMRFDTSLNDHFIIGAFVRGYIDKGNLKYAGDVEIAGWTTCRNMQQTMSLQPPNSFQSKLNVIAVPCTSLMPINDLFQHIHAGVVNI
jgi:hypothetical protein